MAKFQKYELLQEYFFQNENKIKSLFWQWITLITLKSKWKVKLKFYLF